MKTIYSIYLSSIAIASASAKPWLPVQYHHDHSDKPLVLSSHVKNNLVEATDSILFHNKKKDSSPPKFLRRLEDACTAEMYSLEDQLSEAFDQYTNLSFDDFTFNITSMEITLDMTFFPRDNATQIQFACENGEDTKGVFYLMDSKVECPDYTMIVKSVPHCKGLSCDDDSLLEFWKKEGVFSFSSECEMVEIKEHALTCQEESRRVMVATAIASEDVEGPAEPNCTTMGTNETIMNCKFDGSTIPENSTTVLEQTCEDQEGDFLSINLKLSCPDSEYEYMLYEYMGYPWCSPSMCDDDGLAQFILSNPFDMECTVVEYSFGEPPLTCETESMRVSEAIQPVYDTMSGPRTECTEDTSTNTTVCVSDGTVIPTENITIIQELCESDNVGGNLRIFDGIMSCQYSGFDGGTVIQKMVGCPYCVSAICSDDDLFAYFDSDPDCDLIELKDHQSGPTDSTCEDEMVIVGAADLIHDMNDLSHECLTIPGSRTICNVVNPSNMSAFESTCENDNIGGRFYSTDATVVCFDPTKDPSTLITEYRDFPMCLGMHCVESDLISMLRNHFENENCVVLGLNETSYGLTGMF
jgi:hypothetical protein